MRKKTIFSIIFIVALFINAKCVYGASAYLSISDSSVNVGDEFSVSVGISGMDVASLTARIIVDTSKVEYLSGPANSNFSNGRAIYSWTDSTGGENPITSGTIATFYFRAISEGTAGFGISGEFYDTDENEIDASYSGTSISIMENTMQLNDSDGDETEQNGQEQDNNSSIDDTNYNDENIENENNDNSESQDNEQNTLIETNEGEGELTKEDTTTVLVENRDNANIINAENTVNTQTNSANNVANTNVMNNITNNTNVSNTSNVLNTSNNVIPRVNQNSNNDSNGSGKNIVIPIILVIAIITGGIGYLVYNKYVK